MTRVHEQFCRELQISYTNFFILVVTEVTGEKTFKSEYITPGAGIDLEFETDGK
jgi:hypothetical protein